VHPVVHLQLDVGGQAQGHRPGADIPLAVVKPPARLGEAVLETRAEVDLDLDLDLTFHHLARCFSMVLSSSLWKWVAVVGLLSSGTRSAVAVR
jgi:hypothetical protein